MLILNIIISRYIWVTAKLLTMKNKSLTPALLFAATLLLFAGCKKGDDAPPPPPPEETPKDTCLVTEVISYYNGDSSSYKISYNANATIKSKIGRDLGSIINAEYTYEPTGLTITNTGFPASIEKYNADGKLILKDAYQGGPRTECYYDDRGNLIRKFQFTPSKIFETFHYEYNLQNQKIKEYIISKWYGPEPYKREKKEKIFTYQDPTTTIIEHFSYLSSSDTGDSFKDTTHTATTVNKYNANGLLVTSTSTNIPSSLSDRLRVYEWDGHNNLIKEEWFDGNSQSMYIMEYTRTYDSAGRQTSVAQYRDGELEFYYRYVYTCWD